MHDKHMKDIRMVSAARFKMDEAKYILGQLSHQDYPTLIWIWSQVFSCEQALLYLWRDLEDGTYQHPEGSELWMIKNAMDNAHGVLSDKADPELKAIHAGLKEARARLDDYMRDRSLFM